MTDTNRYGKRGVSATKSEVHEAIKHLDKGLYPMAFCKILPDLAGGDDDYCNIMHADTAGTKTSLAYIYWKETKDLSVWTGVVQDAIVMNIDDMACTGCIENIIISSTIGRNKSLIPGEVIKKCIEGSQVFIDKMESLGIFITLAGGETADVGDIVRTIDVGITAFGRMPRKEVITNRIEPGDIIVGFASYGQATYEDSYNGGMGSNGLTSARHDILSKYYALQYPESYDNHVDEDLIYCGSKKLSDIIRIDDSTSRTIGQLILSPTRTYLPVIRDMLAKHAEQITGMIHCTGGGQTKILKFIKNRRIVKDDLLPIPPLFQLIEEESGTSRKEMYQVFNMGHRLEAYCDEDIAKDLIDIAASYSIDAKVIGHVSEADENELIIQDDQGTYQY
ncbi:MAG: phosphoribosylformylglycinamidine cyclo-ligase [Saprospiraceae bacterium]|nr:phosphoribosylformylglycinamidine cyclo-ligase [Saprospiraceae bacterium]